MSLRSEIGTLYDQGLPDPVVRARMSGRATSEVIRSMMSKARIARGMVLRPDLRGPRSQRPRSGAAMRPLGFSLPPATLARLDAEAAACGLARSALARQIIEAALAAEVVGQRP